MPRLRLLEFGICCNIKYILYDVYQYNNYFYILLRK